MKYDRRSRLYFTLSLIIDTNFMHGHIGMRNTIFLAGAILWIPALASLKAFVESPLWILGSTFIFSESQIIYLYISEKSK